MIRLLTSTDASALRHIRLLSLQTDPKSFISTYEHEQNYDNYYFEYRIRSATKLPIFGLYGYFISTANSVASTLSPKPSALVAYAQLAPDFLPKASHLAYIYELYVHPDHRGNRLATSLINHLIKQAQTQQTLEQLHLRVNSTNLQAIGLYQKLGFTHIATRPRAIKEPDGTYQDEMMLSLALSQHKR